MNPTNINEDRKQHLNLPDEAWSIIQSDCFAFSNTSTPIPLTTFLNKIIFHFYETAHASLTIRYQKQKQKYRKILNLTDSKKGLQKYAKEWELLDKLMLAYQADCEEEYKKYPKGSGIKFRLNNQNTGILFDLFSDDTSVQGHKTAGKYLNALFTEYAKLSYSEREKIYFKDIFEVIAQSIKNKTFITYMSAANNRFFTVAPYKICTVSTLPYHYLACFASSETDDELNQIVSLRISRIVNPVQTKHTFSIADSEKDRMETALKEKGSAYLHDHAETIKVRLSDAGIQIYNRKAHQRPQYIAQNDHIYEFCCTKQQAFHYFVDFGPEAYVLEPQSLQIEMKSFFEKGYQNYL